MDSKISATCSTSRQALMYRDNHARTPRASDHSSLRRPQGMLFIVHMWSDGRPESLTQTEPDLWLDHNPPIDATKILSRLLPCTHIHTRTPPYYPSSPPSVFLYLPCCCCCESWALCSWNLSLTRCWVSIHFWTQRLTQPFSPVERAFDVKSLMQESKQCSTRPP